MVDYSLIGLALISCQRVEFLTLGIVSHFNSIKSDKRFKKLSPEAFLDDTSEGRKVRKQTLGQVFRILKQENKVAISDKLDDYLECRNILVHELWRKYLKDRNSNNAYPDLAQFCKTFIEKSSKVEKFYKGFLYIMALSISLKGNVEIPPYIIEFKNHYYYFLECLDNQDFI